MRTNLVQRVWWRVVVLDEGHIIKNAETQISQVVRKLHADARLLLTGTPLQNNLTEFWSILNWLEPELFGSSDRFDAAFDLNGMQHQVDNAALSRASALGDVFICDAQSVWWRSAYLPRWRRKWYAH